MANIPVNEPETTAPAAQEPELSPEQIEEQRIEELRQKMIKLVDAGKTVEDICAEVPGLTHQQARDFSIKRHYDAGHGTIQDYARIYRLDVKEVLQVLEQEELASIQFIGDLIDQEEAGDQAVVNATGQKYSIPYDPR